MELRSLDMVPDGIWARQARPEASVMAFSPGLEFNTQDQAIEPVSDMPQYLLIALLIQIND